MDNAMGGDLKAGSRAIAQNTEEEKLRDAQRQGMAETAAPELEKEKETASSLSSSRSISEDENLRKLDSKIVKVRDAPTGDAAFDHLPKHEKAILKRQLEVPEVKVTFKTLFRFASGQDMLIFYIACICSIAAGAALPLMTVRSASTLCSPSEANWSIGRLWQLVWELSRHHPQNNNTGRILPHLDHLYPLFRVHCDRRVLCELRCNCRIYLLRGICVI